MFRLALFGSLLLLGVPAANASDMPATPFGNVAGEPYVQGVPAITYVRDAQKNGVDPTTAAVLERIDQSLAGVVPGLTVQSAYRSAKYNASVGGARASQHIQGRAIDLDLSSFTPEQKRSVLAAVLAQPEVKGIGVYDSGLNVLHFDTRSGDRVAWGPDYATTSLGRVLKGYTRAMLADWLNGTAPTPPIMTASIMPLPTLRPGEGGPTGDALAEASIAPSPAGQPRALPAEPASRTAESWLAVSLQPGAEADVTGGTSPLYACTVSEPSVVSAGPFGGDAVVRAAAGGPSMNVFNVTIGLPARLPAACAAPAASRGLRTYS